MSARLSPGTSHFNPRSREGSDITLLSYYLDMVNFNPRSREGSDRMSSNTGIRKCHFNPRSREGSDSTMIHLMTNI